MSGPYHAQVVVVSSDGQMVLNNSPWTRYRGDKSHLSLIKEPVSVNRRQHVGRDHMAVTANRPKRQNCEELLSVLREK